jgi:hypothetical protein
MCIEHPSQGLSGQGEKLIAHLHLELTFRMGEVIHCSASRPSLYGQGQEYPLHLYINDIVYNSNTSLPI